MVSAGGIDEVAESGADPNSSEQSDTGRCGTVPHVEYVSPSLLLADENDEKGRLSVDKSSAVDSLKEPPFPLLELPRLGSDAFARSTSSTGGCKKVVNS